LSSSEEELPYPYNTLSTKRNGEIRSQLKVVKTIIKRPEAQSEIMIGGVNLQRNSSLYQKIYAARMIFQNSPLLKKADYDAPVIQDRLSPQKDLSSQTL
jgi:hypothetical protein